MPVFQLTNRLIFPNPELAGAEGVLAIGGDLSEERLLLAYKSGIFPWFTASEPIVWWSPNPRSVIFPSEIKISKSMKQSLRKNDFQISINQDFYGVISACSKPRVGQNENGAWLNSEMIDAYQNLHRKGWAHSVEVWNDEELVGGLYGIAMGKVFFGESMFSNVSNASKIALIFLASFLEKNGFDLIDCQIHNDHLESMGSVLIERSIFLNQIEAGIDNPPNSIPWEEKFDQESILKNILAR